MLATPRQIGYYYPGEDTLSTLPERFGILCWNLNKEKDPYALKRLLDRWRDSWKLRLLFFQEARFDTLRQSLEKRCELHAAANLQISQRLYGVATASPVKATNSFGGHTGGRELLVGPKKPYLTTSYETPKGSQLLSLNIHAINFREAERYRRELERLKSLLQRHEGPMIVAGDFNQWNRSRQEKLESFRKALGLKLVNLQSHRVKSFGGYPLDLVFYRGVELREYSVVETELSDHNPILASFSLAGN